MTTDSKSKWIAFALCFFLGGIGAHRFYIGRYVSAVVQLLTFGGLGLWALVDLILILVDKLPDGNDNALT